MPFVAESAPARLIKRTQERAIRVSKIDADIPEALSGIVSKCLDRDPTARYTSIQELGEEIEVTSQTKKRTKRTTKATAKKLTMKTTTMISRRVSRHQKRKSPLP
jgi:serine/threonine protein kinase